MFAEHDVEVLPETRLASILGDRHDVKSHHHQGFGELGRGLRESARAPDGTVEALEDPTRRFTLGVLWHPEEGEDLALFEALVEAAASHARVAPSGHGRAGRDPSPNQGDKSVTSRPQTMRRARRRP